MDDWKAWTREIAYDRIDQIERHLNACPEAFPEFAEAADKLDAAMDETDAHPDAKLTERDELWMTYSAALSLEMYLAGTRDGGPVTMRSSQVYCRRFRSVRRKSMNRITPDELAGLRSHYPKGSRVELIRMNAIHTAIWKLVRWAQSRMWMTSVRFTSHGTAAPRWAWYTEWIRVRLYIRKEENGMSDRIRKALGDLKARQGVDEHMPCPRCGRDTMKENIHTNALSRHADVYICDVCGTEEALLKFMSNPLSVAEWACFRPAPLPSNFKTLPAEEVWKRVQDAHLPFLMNLYERWQEEQAYEDFSDYRAAAFESCPGLTQLWERPFRAEYAAADGTLVLRFRLTDEGVEIAADITK